MVSWLGSLYGERLFACYFRSTIDWSSPNSEKKAGEVLFSYDQFLYLKKAARVAFNGVLTLLSCVERFETNAVAQVIDDMRFASDNLTSVEDGEDAEATLLQFAGVEKVNKTDMKPQVAYFMQKYDLNTAKTLTAETISNSAVQFWIRNSIDEYKYPGENQYFMSKCGNGTELVPELDHNEFVLMTSEVATSVSCQKLQITPENDPSNLYFYLACEFRYSQPLIATCKTWKCNFDTTVYNQYCLTSFWAQLFSDDFDPKGDYFLHHCDPGQSCPATADDNDIFNSESSAIENNPTTSLASSGKAANQVLLYGNSNRNKSRSNVESSEFSFYLLCFNYVFLDLSSDF